MSDRKGSIVLLFIIALAALGFSGYLAFDKFFLTPEPTDDGLILIGLWNDLERNTDFYPWNESDSWLVEFPNNLYNDSNHISVNSSNTSFKLLQKGFYKITIQLILWGLDSTESAVYWSALLRNTTTSEFFHRVDLPANPVSTYYFIQASIYIESTGLDDFAIKCYCNSDDDGFTLSSSGNSQLAIEYVQ